MNDESSSLPEDDFFEPTEGEIPTPEPDPGHPFTTIDRAYVPRNILERPLPHSKDAEIALLSAILRNNVVLDNDAVARLRAEDLFREAHRCILKAMRALRERNTLIDFATLANELEKIGFLDDVGGRIYLRAILNFPQADAVTAHVQIIRDKARLRALIFALNQCLADSYEAEESARKVYGDTLRKIWELGPMFFD